MVARRFGGRPPYGDHPVRTTLELLFARRARGYNQHMKKNRDTSLVTTRSPGALAAHLRSGGGKHDNRPKRQRTRATALRAALADR